eukprot:2035137-Rhodomonas_salina.1
MGDNLPAISLGERGLCGNERSQHASDSERRSRRQPESCRFVVRICQRCHAPPLLRRARRRQ